MQTPSALRALRLVTRLAVEDVSNASYELFKTIMASKDLTDQHWKAARLLVEGAWQQNVESSPPNVGEPKEIFKFLGYHLGLQGAGEDHTPSIDLALEALHEELLEHRANPLIVQCAQGFNCTSPPFVRGMRSVMDPDGSVDLRWKAASLISFISDQWFNSPVPIMDPGEMPEFCEHLTVLVIDDASDGDVIRWRGVAIFFEMFHSPEWREHIVTRFWSILAYCTVVDEEQESFRWCLRNAIELLEFTRGLATGEGLKWWYGTLWFHHDKLGTAVRDEVERIAKDMSLGDGLSDLNLYLNLIGQEVARTRQEVIDLRDESASGVMKLRARLIALEGNHHRLGRITASGRR